MFAAHYSGPCLYRVVQQKAGCANSPLQVEEGPMARKKWNRHLILAELRSRGMTLAKLAEIYGISPHSVRHVWKRPNAKAEAAIASFLGEPVEELFDDRYPKRTAVILSSKYERGGASPISDRDDKLRSAA